jgi:hypothetical protein
MEEVKSPQQLAQEAKEAEENRLASQAQFDPKVHGVGVHPAMGPQSVTELHAMFLALDQRVAALEAARPVPEPAVPPKVNGGTANSSLKGTVK